MQQINLTDENFLLECAKNYKMSYYNNTDEFLTDLKRIKYIKKLLTRYKNNGNLDERLVLNHIIVLNNVFGPTFLCRILFLKLVQYHEQLKPFLSYLSLLPEYVTSVNNTNYNTNFIKMDETITKKLLVLRKLSKEEF